ncbi:MAG: HDOD domain-containing protein [Burkholderiales bacterium]|nr:HDOD domain-containing protein [Burkholderiales bacterium]
MNTISIDDIIKRTQSLPALSSVVSELLDSIDREETDTDSIARKIMQDQVLTAKTLRLANSSFYGMQHKISSIQEAISVLGLRNIRTLVTATAITGSFQSQQIRAFDFKEFWQHSIATAACARQLARHVKANTDQAFTAGLLHDIGKLALAAIFPDEYIQVVAYQTTHHCEACQAEQQIFGSDHAFVGKILTGRWNFPADMQSAIAFNHTEIDANTPLLSAIVQIADLFSRQLDRNDADVLPILPDAAIDRLQLSEEHCRAILAQAREQFHDISQVLLA